MERSTGEPVGLFSCADGDTCRSVFYTVAMNRPITAFSNFQQRIPDGDTHQRQVCSDCNWIHYENPRVIASALCIWQNQVLLCRRAIPPRYGFWTLPGGFMEIGETIEDAACREVREEAGANVSVESLLATYSIPRIGQVHMVYLARLNEARWDAGTESLDVQLFPLQDDAIPWDDLAFPVNHWTLKDYFSLQGRPVQQPFSFRPEHAQQRMSRVEFHPDYPPPPSPPILPPILPPDPLEQP